MNGINQNDSGKSIESRRRNRRCKNLQVIPENQVMGSKLLVFVILVSVGVSSSSSNQYSQSSYDANSNKHSTTLVSCHKRYVAEAYFREYDSLVDSNFQEFVHNKLLLNSGKSAPRLLDLERKLIGEGSHRRLSSTIRLNIQADLIPAFFSQLSEVIIIERLPSGVFADPFELEHFVNRGVFKDASVFGDVNLELPSFHSNRSVVEVHLDAAVNKSAGHESVHEFEIEIPLHARYAALEDSGYSEVRFNAPDLLICCKSPEELPTPSYLLTPIAVTSASLKHDIVWSIASGIKAHAGTVSLLTFVSALSSALSIIVASLHHSHVECDDRLKQS